MEYAKYLNCNNCKEVGLYCLKHRREMELKLKKRELRQTLEIKIKSLSKRDISNLLEAYIIWNA